MRIIQAIALAAAVIGLLLTTPSIEARTHKKTSHRKKMKIVFDGSTPAPQGELGDELAPRASDRHFSDSRSTVRLRGGSVEELWKKSKSSKSTASASASASPIIEDENPDLIEPASYGEAETPASKLSAKPTLLSTGSSVDESALGSFKRSSPKKAASKPKPKTKLVAKLPKATKTVVQRDAIDEAFNPRNVRPAPVPVVTVSNQTRPPEDSMPDLQFDEAKPVARKSIALEKPSSSQSKIYLRNVQPVARQQTRVATNNAPSELKFNFAFENTTSMGRKVELETPGGRNYMMKNEVFVGLDHSSGWGAKIAANYITTSNDDSTKDIREMGDPSIIIAHPSIYKSIDINIYGSGRYYLPVATFSKTNGLQHLAYSLLADVQLVEGLALHNELTGRYYIQSKYADTDAFSLLSDHTELSKKFESFSIGIGQRTQIESHQAVAPGTSVELYPFANLLAISNTILQAKVYVPLIANGFVNGAPGSPSGPLGSGFSNIQAEFSARISF